MKASDRVAAIKEKLASTDMQPDAKEWFEQNLFELAKDIIRIEAVESEEADNEFWW